jgi:hypothetical protein
LWSYNNDVSNTRDAHQSLFSIIRDDDKHQLMFSNDRYDSQVESGIKFLQEKRYQAKERLEAYLETDEQAIDARTIQLDKATEEWGGSTQYILSCMVWIPGPDYYFG